MFDYGAEGVIDTTNALKEESIQYVGAGKNDFEAQRAIIVTHDGLRIGFLAFSASGEAAKKSQPGVSRLREENILGSLRN